MKAVDVELKFDEHNPNCVENSVVWYVADDNEKHFLTLETDQITYVNEYITFHELNMKSPDAYALVQHVSIALQEVNTFWMSEDRSYFTVILNALLLGKQTRYRLDSLASRQEDGEFDEVDDIRVLH